jgi:uncharacterized circularly permuted ATP-grasp superfamily protein/uncharacterized alpha-E superfamily protein
VSQPFARLDTYRSDAQRYDELLEVDGSVRAHWRPLIERLARGDAQAVRRGVEIARRLIVENGVTYNVYADPQGRDRPWALDPLPLLLTAAEWQEIERGVIQRARVLDAMLADLYGPQHLLAAGLVPPQLPFGHPNFLWPCQRFEPRDGHWLHVYGVDISRSADGRWWALADRTQTPSGMGYALENRQIVTRIFPELAGDLCTRSLGGFFGALRDYLLGQAPAGESALAVVLTPGPFNETYFEHAYLARQLGLPLVEGQDLTVRQETVYLKTLGGLQRVHAILRRLDDDFCDPVELRADSALGVPGLISAARAGNVLVANALGSGVLESAAWMGFMPAASQRLLGEPLSLPSVATWWCGEPAALRYVLQNLEQLVIKPAYPNQRFEAVFGRDLDPAARDALGERIRARPYGYVAQERLAFSQAPVWRGGSAAGIAARALGIRVYAIATPDGYRVMPGGLARIASDEAVDVVSMQRGGGSKDVWVLAPRSPTGEEPGEPGAVRAQRRHDELPSRLVENLFWLGRYSERCECKARLLRASLAARANAVLWPVTVEACRHFGVLRDEDDVLAPGNPLGLAADLQRLAGCAAQVRSRLSAENWRAVGVVQREFAEATDAGEEPLETLDRMLLSLAGLAGFAMDDMTQDDGWRFLMIGRRLERLQFLAELLGRFLGRAAMPTQPDLEWLLDIGDSTITFRTRYQSSPQLRPTIELLVFDAGNPRALAFQWQAIHRAMVQLCATLGGVPDEALQEPIVALEALEFSLIEAGAAGTTASRQRIGEQLLGLAAAAGRLSDRLSLRHFSLIDTQLRMVAA